MSFLSYVLLYLLGAVISFFVIPKVIEFEVSDAQTLIFASLFFPLCWFLIITIGGYFYTVKCAEKYLEYINKDKSS